jgi:hypothetical protein
VSDSDPRSADEADRRSAAVTFLTTEHFVLQGARAATIAESNGRANMFLAAVSGGLVALGLVATASSLGAAFYGFGLILLPTLAFVGLVTFERTLQSSIEDTEYARRIALLRGYYFEHAPEIAPYARRSQVVRLDADAAPMNTSARTSWSSCAMWTHTSDEVAYISPCAASPPPRQAVGSP